MTEGDGCGKNEPLVRLTAKWDSLIEKLYSPNVNSIADYLPEIVALIQSSNPKSAETGLLSVFHSPAVRNYSSEFQLDTPATVIPNSIFTDLCADAARFPVGAKLRDHAKALFRFHAQKKALTMEQAVAIWVAIVETFGLKRDNDEATAKRALRARERLGISRRRGRPKKKGQI